MFRADVVGRRPPRTQRRVRARYREIGPWRDYAFGEKTYLALRLVAKSLLAWQISARSLAS